MNLNSYIESDKEISVEVLQETMSRIRSVMRTEWSDIDTSPSSPFGSLVLVPLAKTIALYEDAANCVLKDTILTNAINGLACDCNFVKEFITTLGLSSLLEANSTGMVRVYYNRTPKALAAESASTTNQPDYLKVDSEGKYYYEIDQGAAFHFDDYNLYPYAAKEGPIRVYDPIEGIEKGADKTYDSTINMKYLTLSTEGTSEDTYLWFVDIPVYGTPDVEISEGARGTVDKTEAELENLITRIDLITPIAPYSFPTKLSELAALFKQIYPSSNFSTKAGVISYIKKKFPKVECISPVTSVVDSDANIRKFNGETFNCLDIYIKSYENLITVNQRVKLFAYDIPEGNTATTIWRGYINNPSYIYKVLSYANHDGSEVINSTRSVFLYNQNMSPLIEDSTLRKLNGFTYCGTAYEKFLLELRITKANVEKVLGITLDNNTISTITTPNPNSDNITSGYIQLSYLADPYLSAISEYLETSEIKPFIDTVVKRFAEWSITEFIVYYYKQQGKYMDRVQALDDLLMTINNLSFPYSYDPAYVADILMLHGAYGVAKVSVSGTLKLTEASHQIDQGTYSLNWPSPIQISSLRGTDFSKSLSDYAKEIETGIKNTAYYLAKGAAVGLIEQKL